MQTHLSGKIQRVTHRHTAEVSKQTGFPSAATHYMEVSIDLNKELVHHKEATFFVRVAGNDWENLGINHDDVLIIDRSFTPKKNKLVLVVEEGAFTIKPMPHYSECTFCVWGVITYVIKKVL